MSHHWTGTMDRQTQGLLRQQFDQQAQEQARRVLAFSPDAAYGEQQARLQDPAPNPSVQRPESSLLSSSYASSAYQPVSIQVSSESLYPAVKISTDVCTRAAPRIPLSMTPETFAMTTSGLTRSSVVILGLQLRRLTTCSKVCVLLPPSLSRPMTPVVNTEPSDPVAVGMTFGRCSLDLSPTLPHVARRMVAEDDILAETAAPLCGHDLILALLLIDQDTWTTLSKCSPSPRRRN